MPGWSRTNVSASRSERHPLAVVGAQPADLRGGRRPTTGPVPLVVRAEQRSCISTTRSSAVVRRSISAPAPRRAALRMAPSVFSVVPPTSTPRWATYGIVSHPGSNRPTAARRRAPQGRAPGPRRPRARRARRRAHAVPSRRAPRRPRVPVLPRAAASGPVSGPALRSQLPQQVERGVGDDGAGREDRRRAHVAQRLHVVGRDHSADHDHHVLAPQVGQRLLQRRHQGQVAGGQGVDAHDVHVGVDRLLGDLLRRGEQRAHVDVEAEVGEGGDDHLLAPVVAVLAHLRHQDAGAAALVLGELLGRLEHLRHGLVGGPGLGAVHPGDRTDRRPVAPVDLLQRVGDLPHRRLGVRRLDRQRRAGCPRASRLTPLGRPSRPTRSARPAHGVRRPRRARRAAAPAWRPGRSTPPRCRPAARRGRPRSAAGRC